MSSAAATSPKEVLQIYRQILKRVNKNSSSMQRQQGVRYVKEIFRTKDAAHREQLMALMSHYYEYLKDFDGYTDLMQMYRVGQHDTPLQDILRSTAKRVGFDMDMSYEDAQKQRHELMKQQEQEGELYKQE